MVFDSRQLNTAPSFFRRQVWRFVGAVIGILWVMVFVLLGVFREEQIRVASEELDATNRIVSRHASELFHLIETDLLAMAAWLEASPRVRQFVA
ncbi:hypothetical protein ACFONG_14455 [Uliginosibacterium paludis]|uniref:hypothetical protein n=1 Tax=Uliginosibacterium paludis TaxID=1615952 RepID=UPI0031F65CD1